VVKAIFFVGFVLFGFACAAAWMYLYWSIGGWWFWAMIPSAILVLVAGVSGAFYALDETNDPNWPL